MHCGAGADAAPPNSSLLLSALSVQRLGHPSAELVNPPEVIAQLIALHPEAVEPHNGQCPLFAALTADKSKTAELVVRMLAVPEAVKFKRDGDEADERWPRFPEASLKLVRCVGYTY